MLFKKKITIEPLKPDEYYKCSNIWNMKNQPLADKWYEEIISGNRLVFIYKINGKFIGEGSLVKETEDPDYTIPDVRIYVSRMIVKKEYRNKGIGSEILKYIIEKAESMGYSEMTIGVDKINVNALHLYKKFGFTEVLYDGEDEHGEYLKLMKKISLQQQQADFLFFTGRQSTIFLTFIGFYPIILMKLFPKGDL